MHRALDSAIGLPSISSSAWWMLALLMPLEVSRNLMLLLLVKHVLRQRRLVCVGDTLHETEVVPVRVSHICEIAHPRHRPRLVHLAAPSGHRRRKGGPHILYVHRAREAKLRNGSLGGTLALAQATINARIPLTGLDEPVIHPLDL